MERWKRIRGTVAAITAGSLIYLVALLGMSWLSQASGCTSTGVPAECQAWLWANPFWTNFYSNLMSTIVGAALGLWAALWLNGKTEAGRRRDEQQAEAQRRQAEQAAGLRRLASMLDLLVYEVDRLKGFLSKLVPSLRNKSGVSAPLTSDVWKALASHTLPALASDNEGANVAQQLSAFYDYLYFVDQSLAMAVDEGRKYAPKPIPPESPFYNPEHLAVDVEHAIKLATGLKAALHSLAKSSRKRAVQLSGHQENRDAEPIARTAH